MSSKPSLGQRWSNYQPSKSLLVWSCIGSVVATIVVGFTWGGWVTGGSAREMATASADEARSELVTALCVDRFNAAADVSLQLEELKKLQSWSRREFIEKGGWTTMPGNATKATRAATACADQLLAANAGTIAAPVVR